MVVARSQRDGGALGGSDVGAITVDGVDADVVVAVVGDVAVKPSTTERTGNHIYLSLPRRFNLLLCLLSIAGLVELRVPLFPLQAAWQKYRLYEAVIAKREKTTDDCCFSFEQTGFRVRLITVAQGQKCAPRHVVDPDASDRCCKMCKIISIVPRRQPWGVVNSVT